MYIVQNKKFTINPMIVIENDEIPIYDWQDGTLPELICLGECSKRAQVITSIYAVEMVF